MTINHRLNLFGYIKLDDPDERFAQSGNAGMLDIVAALQWVRDNIAAFGGDPANVAIFGQSGGGAKVSAMLACSAARGLFHKAIAESCSVAYAWQRRRKPRLTRRYWHRSSRLHARPRPRCRPYLWRS